MSLLLVSSTNITFEPSQTVKTIQLNNMSQIQSERKPIMYKIKTNKIDYVDAKPSCGYISGKDGENQITILIRSLKDKKQYSAKLQILYITHDRITEQVVQRNKKHFDMNEYTQNYEAIKNANKNDVKSIIISVNKKAQNLGSSAPLPPSNPNPASSLTSSLVFNEPKMERYDSEDISMGKKTFCICMIFMLLAGLLAGFALGNRYGNIIFGGNSQNQVERQDQVQNTVQQPAVTQQQTEDQIQQAEQHSNEVPSQSEGRTEPSEQEQQSIQDYKSQQKQNSKQEREAAGEQVQQTLEPTQPIDIIQIEESIL